MDEVVNCYYNYVVCEKYYEESVFVICKGVVWVWVGDLGIIFGSMGVCFFIVWGKGNLESFCSCSYGVGCKMSCMVVRKWFFLVDYVFVIEGVECCKDEEVIDEML